MVECARGMEVWFKCLPHKCEALNSNSSTEKENQKRTDNSPLHGTRVERGPHTCPGPGMG
jgi:hypothetical protein